MHLVASVFVTIFLFVVAYLPQAAFLTLVNGPLGFVTAVPLVLGESGAIVLFLARVLWLAPVLDDIFDQVLLEQGLKDLVAQGREIRGHGKASRLGKSLTSPLNRFSKEGIVRYLISLPLNAIPVVGTVLFLLYNGNKSGPSHHARYFQLKKFTDTQKDEAIRSKRGSYAAFGTAAMVLNLIPGASILLAFTTAAGAALWASDLEKKQGVRVDVNVSDEATQEISETGKKAV
ncbi:hypothetical protein FRB99_005126 [Tulasnella sp. 403]|nr:hypothetical protein FRB99_005126 [Tulasnella sp. 403]